MHPALVHLPKGWFHHGEHALALMAHCQPKVVVELGTFLGASAIATARVVQAWNGVVYCVDTWAGCPRMTGRARWPYRIFECATNLVIADVSAQMRLIPATTAAAAAAWTGPAIDWLYVDADHSYEGCAADLAAWWPHVRSGGVLAGDDYDHPRCPGVRQAWDECEQARGLVLHRMPTAQTTPPGMQFVWGVKP